MASSREAAIEAQQSDPTHDLRAIRTDNLQVLKYPDEKWEKCSYLNQSEEQQCCHSKREDAVGET